MKRILLITYYWPPKGGVGVQRWLKLSKYLYKENYNLIVYTPLGGVYPLKDETLLKYIPSGVKVLRKKIFEPQKLLSFFTKKKPASDVLIKDKPSILNKILVWLRANIFIPDSRCFWIKPSVNFLDKYLKKNSIDLIISTGPPHSMHLIALALKHKHNVKWIADFRDPWTYIEYFDKLPLLSFVRKKHKDLEKKVLKIADLILSVSPSWSHQLHILGARKTFTLTNGYDPDHYHFNSWQRA